MFFYTDHAQRIQVVKCSCIIGMISSLIPRLWYMGTKLDVHTDHSKFKRSEMHCCITFLMSCNPRTDTCMHGLGSVQGCAKLVCAYS